MAQLSPIVRAAQANSATALAINSITAVVRAGAGSGHTAPPTTCGGPPARAMPTPCTSTPIIDRLLRLSPVAGAALRNRVISTATKKLTAPVTKARIEAGSEGCACHKYGMCGLSVLFI
jgi:hypothetical protein